MITIDSRNDEGLNVFNDDNVAGANFYGPALAFALVRTGARNGNAPPPPVAPGMPQSALKLPAVKLLECRVGGAGDEGRRHSLDNFISASSQLWPSTPSTF